MKGKIARFCLRYQEVLFWLGIGLALDVAFLMIKDAPLVADEGYHLPQISGFLNGDFSVSPNITVLPAYHAIMAIVLKILGAQSVADARLVTFLGSMANIWFFYLIVRRLWPEERFLRTAQFTFLPILFPMYFLIYTDTWALAFVLLALERTLAKRPWQSAVALAVAIAIRQPNVIWAGMLWAFLVWRPHSFIATWRYIRASWMRNTLPFALIFLGFSGFLLMNHGVAVGDKHQHEVKLNLSNIWFFSLCFFMLFFPTCIATTKRLGAVMRARPIFSTAGLGVGLFTFLASYNVTHQYNQPSLWFYLRNRLLFLASHVWQWKILSFLPTATGLAGFALLDLPQKRFKLFIPLTLASIVVMPLIEQRYYLVPFTMALAFRRQESKILELVNTGFYVVCSFLLLEGISQGKFFL